MSEIKLSLIVALTNNNVIGDQGKMPWHLPKDLAYFKKTTLNHPIIMGRKTYASIGFALPERDNIVISQNPDYQLDDAIVCRSPLEAVKYGHQIAEQKGLDQVFVIGGATIFKALLHQADQLYLNRILVDLSGDTFFPKINFNQWIEIKKEHHPVDSNNQYAMDFIVYQK